MTATRLDRPFAFAALAALATATACSSHRAAGAIHVPSEQPHLLRVVSDGRADVHVLLWNRGPAIAAYAQRASGTGEEVIGTLPNDRSEFRWQTTTAELALRLSASGDPAGATIGYVIEADRPFVVHVAPEESAGPDGPPE